MKRDKRLTERTKNGEWRLRRMDSEQLPTSLERADWMAVREAINRLAEYEESGLSPLEIEAVMRSRAEEAHLINQVQSMLREAWWGLREIREMMLKGQDVEREMARINMWDAMFEDWKNRKLCKSSNKVTVTPVVDITMPPGTTWNCANIAENIRNELEQEYAAEGPGERVLKRNLQQ